MTDDGGARCSEYPRLSDLHFNNKYWQMFQFLNVNPKTNMTLDMNFYLFVEVEYVQVYVSSVCLIRNCQIWCRQTIRTRRR